MSSHKQPWMRAFLISRSSLFARGLGGSFVLWAWLLFPALVFADAPASMPTSIQRPEDKAGAAGGASKASEKVSVASKPKRFRHEFEGRIHVISEHTGLDSGFAPEFQYRFRMDNILDLRAGIRFAAPGFGDNLRYYLAGFIHVPLPLVRDGSLGVMVMHNSYGDIQKGENTFFFLHHFDTRYFAFDGGLVLRMELTRPDNFRNPFSFSTEYMEVFYVYDMRVKIDFTFPKLGGSKLEFGLGLMNFLDNDVVGPATGGYRLFASWDQPKVGRFEVMGGLMSYGFWAFAGYYGRWFLRFSYTYALDI